MEWCVTLLATASVWKWLCACYSQFCQTAAAVYKVLQNNTPYKTPRWSKPKESLTQEWSPQLKPAYSPLWPTLPFCDHGRTLSGSRRQDLPHIPLRPDKQAALSLHVIVKRLVGPASRDSTRTTPVLCQLQFSRCWRGRLTLILSVTMFSNYHSLHTNMIAWLAALFPWQLLWFWLCQSFRSLCSVWHQIAAARAARFFISPHVSDGCLRYILSFYSRKTF